MVKGGNLVILPVGPATTSSGSPRQHLERHTGPLLPRGTQMTHPANQLSVCSGGPGLAMGLVAASGLLFGLRRAPPVSPSLVEHSSVNIEDAPALPPTAAGSADFELEMSELLLPRLGDGSAAHIDHFWAAPAVRHVTNARMCESHCVEFTLVTPMPYRALAMLSHPCNATGRVSRLSSSEFGVSVGLLGCKTHVPHVLLEKFLMPEIRMMTVSTESLQTARLQSALTLETPLLLPRLAPGACPSPAESPPAGSLTLASCQSYRRGRVALSSTNPLKNFF